jgi:hypothetical protein
VPALAGAWSDLLREGRGGGSYKVAPSRGRLSKICNRGNGLPQSDAFTKKSGIYQTGVKTLQICHTMPLKLA